MGFGICVFGQTFWLVFTHDVLLLSCSVIEIREVRLLLIYSRSFFIIYISRGSVKMPLEDEGIGGWLNCVV